jgi:hypothetical protein
MMVVEMEPFVQCGHPLVLGAVGPDVGPLLKQGAVEAFDFAVGLWPVGLCSSMNHGAEGVGEEPASVAAAVEFLSGVKCHDA